MRRFLQNNCLILMLLCGSNTALAKAGSCPAYAEMQALLNSQRIKSCFGSYGVEVLQQDGNIRISSLYSLEGEQKITRTLAISEFSQDLPDSLQAAYETIRAGASMGSSLESAGWRVEKRHRYFGEVPASVAFQCMAALQAGEQYSTLAVQVYDLYAVREEQDYRFALLAELHDPRYLTLQDLQEIYPELINSLTTLDSDSSGLLQLVDERCSKP